MLHTEEVRSFSPKKQVCELTGAPSAGRCFGLSREKWQRVKKINKNTKKKKTHPKTKMAKIEKREH